MKKTILIILVGIIFLGIAGCRKSDNKLGGGETLNRYYSDDKSNTNENED